MAHSKPYERQPGETEEAFAAFTLYRDLGRDRSLDRVADLLRDSRRGRNAVIVTSTDKAPSRHRKFGQLGKWSVDHSWVERCRSWDNFIDSKLRERQLDEIESMAARQAQHFQLAQMVAMKPALEILTALQDPNRAVQLASAPLGDLFELASKFLGKMPRLAEGERFARGVRVMDTRDATPQGGTAEWRVVVHQPPRTEPLPDLEALDAAEPEEWEGDRPNADDD